MFSPPGMPTLHPVMDQSGNIVQYFAYPQYMVGMPPHGAAGPPSTEGYHPMMGNMAAHGMGAHGAPPMHVQGVPVSYGMGIPPQEHTGMQYMNRIPSDGRHGQSQQQRERRNKKKRPVDYYKRL